MTPFMTVDPFDHEKPASEGLAIEVSGVPPGMELWIIPGISSTRISVIQPARNGEPIVVGQTIAQNGERLVWNGDAILPRVQ